MVLEIPLIALTGRNHFMSMKNNLIKKVSVEKISHFEEKVKQF